MPTHSTLERRGSGLCLLSFDAGGSRGISQLKILAEIMHQLNFGANDDKIDRPCFIFDMIGGVGSGGFIAILLVALGLTENEALDEFIDLSVNVLDKPEMDVQARTIALKDHVDKLLMKHEMDLNARLLDQNGRSRDCKLVVPVSYKHHVDSTCILRNYSIRQEQSVNLTIVEAILATLATPPLFESMSVIKDAGTFEYIGAELTLSNPTQEIITHAYDAFGGEERVACLLSLGCGHPGILDLSNTAESMERIRFLENLTMDAERKAQTLESQMRHLGLYHRFSVAHGLERVEEATILDPARIMAHTKVYLDDAAVSQKTDACSHLIRVRDGASSLEQLRYPGGQTMLSSRLPPVTKTFVMRKKPWDFINKIILGPRDSQDSDEPRMLVVTGIGGCGKTQLMLNFMKVHREQFASLFFIDGSSEDRIRAEITRNVRALGNEHSQKGFDDCLLFLSQASQRGARLLLYDNVDDPNIDLFSLLPRGDSCVIAITSRNRILGDLYPDCHLPLDIMSIDEATELLRPSISITDQAQREAIELAQTLGCLPIALQQARSYMQQSKCSVRDYLVRLSSHRARLLGQKIKHQVDMQAISTYAAFETSFDRLTMQAKMFLWILSFFHWSGFPLELVVLAAKYQFSKYEWLYIEPGDDFYTGKKR